MKSSIKGAAAWLLGGWRGALPDGLVVFLYHDVSDRPSPFVQRHDLGVSPATFRAQLRAIKQHFDVVSIDDVLAGRWPKRAALVTFDDGFASVFDTAQPILEAEGVPATVFLNMDPVVNRAACRSALVSYLCSEKPDFAAFFEGCTGRKLGAMDFLRIDEAVLRDYLSQNPTDCAGYGPTFAKVADLRDAEQRGVLTFGNHLYRHFNAENLTDGDLLEQHGLNAAALTGFANSRPVFSYPFGQPGTCYSARTHSVVRNGGAKLVFSAIGRVNKAASDVLHRFVPRGDTARTVRGNLAWNHYRSARVLGGVRNDPEGPEPTRISSAL
jgi:hypothetical protein